MSKLKWSWVYYPYLDPLEKQKESALKAGYNKVYLKSEVDKVIEDLEAKLESVQASAYAESVDAGMENRKLKRALWLARAKSAENAVTNWCPECMKKWNEVERKCRAKAEEYK